MSPPAASRGKDFGTMWSGSATATRSACGWGGHQAQPQPCGERLLDASELVGLEHPSRRKNFAFGTESRF